MWCKWGLQEFSSAVTCAAVIVRFFETVTLTIGLWISFCHCWFSLTVSLRCCCLPMIRVCRHNLRNCPSRCTSQFGSFCHKRSSKADTYDLYPLSKYDKSPIFRFIHTDCHSAQTLMNWHEHYGIQNSLTYFHEILCWLILLTTCIFQFWLKSDNCKGLFVRGPGHMSPPMLCVTLSQLTGEKWNIRVMPNTLLP
jgi:hypothetical protein